MKPILTPEEAVVLDRETQARGGAAATLMERAGRAVARAALEAAGGAYGRRAVVVCGTGNNGGDGLVAARHLARAGLAVDVVAPTPLDGARDPAATNFRRLSEQGIAVRGGDVLPRVLDRADVAIDALFGTGFHGVPDGPWARAIAALNASPAPVVAVDIPSGVDGCTGAVAGDAVRAALTVTFGATKLGAVLLPGAEHAGTVRVVDIGFPDDLVRPAAWLVEADDVGSVWPVRPVEGHKRRSGVLLVIAGSRGMTGAPALIATAAARVGTGLVTVATPSDALPAVQAHVAEAVFLPLPQTQEGTVSHDALEPLLETQGRADAIAIGPGLTRHPETARLVRDVVRRASVPIVLDADGLNAFEGAADELRSREGEAVLTPHDGEFSRLMGVPVEDVVADRPSSVRKLAAAAGAVALLKGTRTVIAEAGGGVRVNPTGGPTLATAGTGDVLTGVIGGLLARGLGAFDAASAGAFVHGLAGMIAGRDLGEGAIASDVVERLPDAVMEVTA